MQLRNSLIQEGNCILHVVQAGSALCLYLHSFFSSKLGGVSVLLENLFLSIKQEVCELNVKGVSVNGKRVY